MDHANTLAAERIPFLSSTEIFHDIEQTALLDLAAQVEELHLEAGETLFRQGDPSDAIYLIVSGQVCVLDAGPGHPEKVLAQLGPGQPVGELALWAGGVHSATVRTVSEVRALKLSREGFERFAKDHPEAVEAVDRFVALRLRKNRLSVALEVSGMFGDLAEPTLRELEAELESEWIEAGTTLFRQGDAGDAVYLVVSGRLRVSVDLADEGPRFLTELGFGETVGEMALLDGKPRSATVVATRDSHLARLSKDAFERLFSRRPDLLVVIARELVARLRTQDRVPGRPIPSSTIIAVAPASPGIPIQEFCARLASTLSIHGPTLLLGSALVDTYLGKPGAAQATERQAGHGRIIELLSKLETDHRCLIYQADASDSLWSRLCLRQCDHILIVGDAARDPREDAEIYVTSALNDRRGRPASLVLLHPVSVILPSGTAAWLAARKVDQHYHVRPDSDSDFGRMARSLTGRAVGLALSGGGIRGAGHSGVIRALREAGVPIDIVGGTSIGAAMAAGAALEHDPQWMVHAFMTASLATSKDWTLPLVSLLSPRRFDDYFHGLIGETQIEDLWLPFFCVSANLTRASIQVHRRGSLLKSLLASMRVPAALPPIPWDGDLLVDGGIIDNIPVDVMRGYADCGTVIASDVSSVLDLSDVSNYGDRISGWRALAQRFKPVSKRLRFPGIFDVLMRIIELGSAARRAQTAKMADLYLAPPVESFGRTDFDRGDEIAEVAYRYSSEKIADWLASSPRLGKARATKPLESMPT
jgi:NTE family protein/lysophospholipid hydrolase